MLIERELEGLRRGYGVTEEVGARLPRGNELAKTPAKGYFVVFESQLKFGLRPIFRLLKEVIEYYEVSITQLFPLGLCRMIAFEIACKEEKVECSLNLLRHYYHIKRTEDFNYMCGRSLSKEFLAKNKGPSTGWRRSYFMVKKENFSRGMEWRKGGGRDLN